MKREDALGECVVNPRALGRHCVNIIKHEVVMVKAAHQQHACVQQRPAIEAQVRALLQKHYVEVDALVLRVTLCLAEVRSEEGKAPHCKQRTVRKACMSGRNCARCSGRSRYGTSRASLWHERLCCSGSVASAVRSAVKASTPAIIHSSAMRVKDVIR